MEKDVTIDDVMFNAMLALTQRAINRLLPLESSLKGGADLQTLVRNALIRQWVQFKEQVDWEDTYSNLKVLNSLTLLSDRLNLQAETCLSDLTALDESRKQPQADKETRLIVQVVDDKIKTFKADEPLLQPLSKYGQLPENKPLLAYLQTMLESGQMVAFGGLFERLNILALQPAPRHLTPHKVTWTACDDGFDFSEAIYVVATLPTDMFTLTGLTIEEVAMVSATILEIIGDDE